MIQSTTEIKNAGNNPAISEKKEEKTITTGFDWENLFSRKEADEKTNPKILPENIEAIKNLLKASYKWVTLTIHQQKDTLFIECGFYTDRFQKNQWSAADKALIYAIMHATRKNYDLINSYKAEDHKPETSKDIALECLKEFLKSKLRGRIRSVNISNKEYEEFTYHISKTSVVKFYLENNEELKKTVESAK